MAAYRTDDPAMAWHNPFAFRPAQVTFWTTAVYLALLVPLVYIHETVPPAPDDDSPRLPSGVSLSEAWLDLANVSQAFHPANSRANDAVRNWLLLRTQEILDQNGVSWATRQASDVYGCSLCSSLPSLPWALGVLPGQPNLT